MTSTTSIHLPDLASTEAAAAATSESTVHLLPAPFNDTYPPPALITQGAEALVYQTHFLTPSTPAALKVRPSKPYRHPILDARLTKQRVLAEARVLVKLSGIGGDVKVPAVLSLEWDTSRRAKSPSADKGDQTSHGTPGTHAWLLMEWINGKSVKELVRDWDVWMRGVKADITEEDKAQAEQEAKALLRKIGRAVGAMHSRGGVVHGDLTSSNVMVRPMPQASSNGVNHEKESTTNKPDLNGEIVLIDFGLAVQSIQDEDRAVDLYVLERAFGSTHPRQEQWFDQEVLQSQDGYRGSFKGAAVVLKRLEEVRLRGRKRSMVG